MTQAQITGGTANGDVYEEFRLDATRSFAIGIDSDDSNALKVTTDAAYTVNPSSGTTLMSIGTAGAVSLLTSISSPIYTAPTALAINASGGDISLTATGTSINLTSTENAVDAIYLRANGGTSETIKIHSDQGTGVASVDILSDVGGVTITGGLATVDAINLTTSNVAGGIDIDAGTAGVDVDSTGQINLTSSQSAADAIRLESTDAGGGIDIDAGATISITSTKAGTNAVRILTSAGGIDVNAETLIDIASGSTSSDAIVLQSSNPSGGVTLKVGTGKAKIQGGSLAITTAAMGLQVEGGAVTDMIGQATLVAGTVTVANTNIATTDRILVTRSALNASPVLGNLITTISAGASFTVGSFSDAGVAAVTDVSSFDYFIVRQL